VADFKLSDKNPNTKEVWENTFSEGGTHDERAGREQTKNFARAFLKYTPQNFPEGTTILDVGCGLGDSLGIWHERYPQYKLAGCDFSEEAIRRAKETYGNVAEFHNWSFEQIEGEWDVIYCSNVLEHFENYKEIAEIFLKRAKTLYILTPYKETHSDGQPISVDRPADLHVSYFDKTTFDYLKENHNVTIETKVRAAVGAWGMPDHSYYPFIMKRMILNTVFGKNLQIPPNSKQIFYTIRRND
jgi:2-polyprenyl-3-methyl-5-hydroxy-6-metoxy-1,4-benzoquinol methylase